MNIPVKAGSSEIEIKRSRFISRAEYFDDVGDLKPMLGKVRADHGGCNHVVYAYAIGDAGDLHGMSDDHEPKGTAGRPVLEVVKGSQVTNLLVTVVRYFGGTKLGTGGLVRAYTEAAQRAVAAMTTEELVAKSSFTVTLPYALYEGVVRAVRRADGIIGAESFTEDVVISGEVPRSSAEVLHKAVMDISAGKISPVIYDKSNSS